MLHSAEKMMNIPLRKTLRELGSLRANSSMSKKVTSQKRVPHFLLAQNLAKYVLKVIRTHLYPDYGIRTSEYHKHEKIIIWQNASHSQIYV